MIASNFTPPADVAECDERMADLRQRIAQIDAQMIDPARRERLSFVGYQRWRSKARYAQSYRRAELDRLRAWKAAWDEERKARASAAARERQAMRLAAAEAEGRASRARRAATIAERPDAEATDIILRLFGAIHRLRRGGAELRGQDIEAMERAHMWLVEIGVFE